MTHLRLSWKFTDEGAVLTFDKKTWALFQAEAAKECTSADELISVTVARLAGKISNCPVRR